MRGLTSAGCAFALLVGMSLDVHAANLSEARRSVQHVIIIMQENRSFDNYFGTFPGADGLPRDSHGNFTTCVPLSLADPARGCVRPFHDTSLYQGGSNHNYDGFLIDRDNGAMDGFVEEQEKWQPPVCRTNPGANPYRCPGYKIHDVMGYHDWREIPNYWHYAESYMLQDHLFAPVGQASAGIHLMLTSEWSADCRNPKNPMSCVSRNTPHWLKPGVHPFAWTSLTWLLDNIGVSWRYYIAEGGTPDCDDQTDSDTCDPEIQDGKTQSLWNPLPGFTTFAANVKKNPGYAKHVIRIEQFYADVANNKLPAVSWIVPNSAVGEHPDNNIVDGMNYVTSLVNMIMQSPYYDNTIIFISWDEWGGFYDHAMPPIVDRSENEHLWGYGLRVPGLVISPYVKSHFDHQVLSFDAYNRFIEDVFLDSQRLDPTTDGRPDSRPNVPEAITTGRSYPNNAIVPIGDLLNDFDFHRKPIRPCILDNHVSDQSPR
jgi:phospholipase C